MIIYMENECENCDDDFYGGYKNKSYSNLKYFIFNCIKCNKEIAICRKCNQFRKKFLCKKCNPKYNVPLMPHYYWWIKSDKREKEKK